MSKFNIIAQTAENTVITEYEVKKTPSSDAYQSEADLEKEFISLLCKQGYEYLKINNESDLITNLRKQLEKLNNYNFSDSEWKSFFDNYISEGDIEDKTSKIQEDYIKNLELDNGTTKNIKLIDKANIHNNILQVINQYVADEKNILSSGKPPKYSNRYDVTILVNGLPLVHIELKRRGIPIKEAFNQINRYQRDSFWSGCGLFEYVQIFVISNGTNTKYYSNTTRFNISEQLSSKRKKITTNNSFDFTSYWTDSKNYVISDLIDFTETFFAKHSLLNILTKYCVFTSEKKLMVMRPYQIIATERILNRIIRSNNNKKYGTKDAGGYIWHTTGSGKTLTSFKTASLASNLSNIDKVLFVVDRKDLDYQTMKEYDRFEKGAANSNATTNILRKQLQDTNARIIITTIQKLSNFIKQNKKNNNKNNTANEVSNKHIVIIFDECHRSQFGEMHKLITNYFKKYYLFGFTGTPIFASNSSVVKANNFFLTTEQIFGEQIHSYTIVDAINDSNVLPFRIDYIKTMDKEEEIEDEMVLDIDRKKAMMAPERIKLVTKYILENFNNKTYRNNNTYFFNYLSNITDLLSAKYGEEKEEKITKSITGFNSIFTVSSIEMAQLYYNEFKKQMKEDKTRELKIATIFSYNVNEAGLNADYDGVLNEENPEDTNKLDKNSRDFLNTAIEDYNKMFETSYDTTGEKFQNYYKDVSLRMKNKELDLLIVVNMFLTGFDATTLNTLWVDKKLKMHGLLQAFSRTNRILNSVKKFGNIVCFRNLQKEVEESIALFGNKDASGIVLIRSFEDYYEGYKDGEKSYPGYKELINKLENNFPLQNQIIGEQKQKEFIALFGSILRMRNILTSFDEFKDKELITERNLQDYLGKYQDLRDVWKRKYSATESTDIINDIVFEIELIKQIDIDIDYILNLVDKYYNTHCEDKEIIVNIKKALYASPELRSKKVLIENFINNINKDGTDDVQTQWSNYVSKERDEELNNIIESENLNKEYTLKFIKKAFENGELQTFGQDICEVMPPISRFEPDSKYSSKKSAIVEKITIFFEKYFGLRVPFF